MAVGCLPSQLLMMNASIVKKDAVSESQFSADDSTKLPVLCFVCERYVFNVTWISLRCNSFIAAWIPASIFFYAGEYKCLASARSLSRS